MDKQLQKQSRLNPKWLDKKIQEIQKTQQFNSNLTHDPSESPATPPLENDEEEARRRIINEARFSLRAQDSVEEPTEKARSKDKRRRHVAPPAFSDYGDDDHAGEKDRAAISDAGRSLASTMNTISQKNKMKKHKNDVSAEFDDNEENDRFMRGLEMMESELGSSDANSGSEGKDIEINDDLDSDDDYYAQIKKKSKKKKEEKRKLYAVAPKYPNLDKEVEGKCMVKG